MNAPNYHTFGSEGPTKFRSRPAALSDAPEFHRPEALMPRAAGISDEQLAEIGLTGKSAAAFALPLNERKRGKLRGALDSLKKRLRLAFSRKPTEEELGRLAKPSAIDVGSAALAKRPTFHAPQIGEVVRANGWEIHTITGRHFGPRLTQPQIEHLRENRLRIQESMKNEGE